MTRPGLACARQSNRNDLGALEMKQFRSFAAVMAAVGLLTLADAAAAQGISNDFKPKAAGDFVVRGRVIGILPDEDSSIDTIGGDARVGDAVVPELDFSYFVTDNIAFELIAATARHEVEAEGTALGDVDLGHVWLLPPTLTAQYHFMPKERFSPYVGAGVNFTLFYNESAGAVDDIEYDNSVGPALQAGFDMAISGPWSLNVDVKKIFLNTEATVEAAGTELEADVDIDPWIFGVGLSYRF